MTTNLMRWFDCLPAVCCTDCFVLQLFDMRKEIEKEDCAYVDGLSPMDVLDVRTRCMAVLNDRDLNRILKL